MLGYDPDPRVAMGCDVESALVGPFELRTAQRTDPSLGGTLDVGIAAYTKDGRKVVIGEIWAKCPGIGPGESLDPIRIDARAIAQWIVDKLNDV